MAAEDTIEAIACGSRTSCTEHHANTNAQATVKIHWPLVSLSDILAIASTIACLIVGFITAVVDIDA